MKSMTGYGKGEAENESRKITIELKAVNNRYLEVNSRIAKAFSFADDIVKKCIQDKIKRGSVDVMFSYSVSSGSGKTVTVDYSLAAEYVKAANILSGECGIANDVSVSSLLRLPDLFSVSSAPENVEELTGLFRTATVNAVTELDKMRETEGESIKRDLARLVGNIADGLKQAAERAPLVITDYKEKLKKRITELCDGITVDEARMAAEVAFFADRCDINEEVSRLSSHIEQFLTALELSETQGRRLDFLSQEMNREINTMGSKANDLTLTNIVIGMKNELEKIKEQIRNVE